MLFRSPSSVQKGVNGNLWIFVPKGDGTWYASPFEGFIGTRKPGNFSLGNLNIPSSSSSTNINHREKILRGGPLDYTNTSLWGNSTGMPQSGVTYGWMISTNAGLYSGSGSYGQERSNIILQTWP